MERSEVSCTHRQFMFLPSLACPARCTYCFGPNRGPVMSAGVFDTALEWIAAFTSAGRPAAITFHGGEPLLAGKAWYRRHLPRLRQRFGRQLRLAVQSNLWLLDDEFCALLQEYGVSLGTSLDGPQEINDAQRGPGHFARTMAGLEAARRHGINPGALCTFTQRSALRYRQVLEFFADAGIAFGVHHAVCPLPPHHSALRFRDREGGKPQKPARAGAAGLALSPQEHADLFVALFDHYLGNITRVRISTFDAMARGVSSGEGGLCTFRHCLGHYLAIAPDGGIYPCNRFAHHSDWRLGSVQEMPTLETLSRSPAWQRLRRRELEVQEQCGNCPHFPYCRGGCAYNAVTGGVDGRDPHCLAYRQVFSHIAERALIQVFSQENLAAVVAGEQGSGLLRKGPLLQIMRGGPHPQEAAGRARELLAAVALADSRSAEEAVQKLDHSGLVTCTDLAWKSLSALHGRLRAPPAVLLNAYLHVTSACNLACDHCYASSGPERTAPPMAVPDVVRLVRQVAAAGFGQVVVTGGEPLMHLQREALLGTLADLRPQVKPLRIMLRTNLAYPLTSALVEQMASSASEIVVSVDGDEATHDARRGTGSYRRTVANLRALLAARPAPPVTLTAVLDAAQSRGLAGQSVRALGKELGLRVRFKSILPLGRALAMSPHRASYRRADGDSAEAIVQAARPIATCGLGMNLYIAPDGECFPCYALVGERHDLGNAREEGLAAVLARNAPYRHATVDTNRRCRRCALRYLCGGSCRAWDCSDDLDAPPADCTALFARARALLEAALEALEISSDRWIAAGLPWPARPPQ